MDFKQKQLVLWFCRSAGAPRPSFEKTYGGFPCIEQTFYTTLGIFYSLCIWKLHRSGVVDPRLNLPLRSKRTIFNTVRQILIHFFVILFTAFWKLSPKSSAFRMRGRHDVRNCSPCLYVDMSLCLCFCTSENQALQDSYRAWVACGIIATNFIYPF